MTFDSQNSIIFEVFSIIIRRRAFACFAWSPCVYVYVIVSLLVLPPLGYFIHGAACAAVGGIVIFEHRVARRMWMTVIRAEKPEKDKHVAACRMHEVEQARRSVVCGKYHRQSTGSAWLPNRTEKSCGCFHVHFSFFFFVHYGCPLRKREGPLCFASSFFFQTLCLRRPCTDVLETSPYDVGSSAVENFPFTCSYVTPKRN